MQWSHRTLGDPVFIILRDTPCFNLWKRLLPRGVWFGLSGMAVCFSEFPLEVAEGLFFRTVKYHGRGNAIAME